MGIINGVILSNATVTGAGSWYPNEKNRGIVSSTFQAVLTGTGAISATVNIEVSNDGVNAVPTPAVVLTPSGTTTANDGESAETSWKFFRANVSAISGTGASVTVYAN